MYDAVVVGAGCAGAATAMLLARRHHRVLLLERAKFPRDAVSTLYIHQPGIAQLADWGVLDRVVSTGCPAIETVDYRVGDVRLRGSSRPVKGQKAAYAPRRGVLDQILVEAAVASGADFQEEATVHELLFVDGRAVGVRYRIGGGRWREERAALVIGADGMRSRVAAQARARILSEHPPKTCVYYTYWALPGTTLSLREAHGRWVGSIPTNDGATLVGCYFPQSDFSTLRKGAYEAYLASFQQHAPEIFDQVSSSDPIDRLFGTGDQQNFIRQAAGSGWALVGDSAHHKDSITARGITDAFVQAQLLVDTVGNTLPSARAVDEALTSYARAHHDLVLDDYRNTLFVADLAVTEERLSMLRTVSSDEHMTDSYFSMLSGACTIEEFFDDEFLARL